MTGVGALLRAAVRRDRVLIPVWIAVLALMVAASAFATADLYAHESERVAAARLVNSSPGLVALYGPILNVHSLGEIAMSKMTVMYALFVMGMGLVIVRRHTRTEEESGRADLVGAGLIAREAPLRASLLLAAGSSLALGVLAAALDLVAGLEPIGSLAFGASWVGAGIVGACTAALACQLTSSTRTCTGITLAIFGAWNVLRAAGDIGPDGLGWLSPLGWGTRLDAWGDTRWWVLGLYLILAAALAVAAERLRARRDLAAGIFADRPGPARGELHSIPALVWRLNRVALAWWLAASVVFGGLFGSIAPHLGGLFDSAAGRAALEALGGKGKVEESMLAALLAVMAALFSAYALHTVVAAGHEELDGRTPVVLAAHGSRAAVFGTQVMLAFAGSALLALGYAAGCAVGYGAQVRGIGHQLAVLVPAALAHVPAIWVVAALGLVVWTVRPALTWLGWAFLAAFVMLSDLGRALKLPEWVLQLSPFEHVVKVPVQPVSWAGEFGLSAVAAALLVFAWSRYRTRDVG